MSANRRTLFWILFLGAAAVIAIVPEFMDDDSELEIPAAKRGRLADLRAGGEASPSAARATTAVPESAAGLTLAQRQAVAAAPAAEYNLFAARTWFVPPPPPPPPPPTPPPPPPPPPSAPPLPFVFIGKLDDSATVRVFLARGERVYSVAEGDVIDNTYRVDKISGAQMTLTYLPLNQPQTLPVGANLR